MRSTENGKLSFAIEYVISPVKSSRLSILNLIPTGVAVVNSSRDDLIWTVFWGIGCWTYLRFIKLPLIFGSSGIWKYKKPSWEWCSMFSFAVKKTILFCEEVL